jgi:hypothetical protein
MTNGHAPSSRAQYTLGPLSLTIEATVARERYERWLPRTSLATDAHGLAALWVGGSDQRGPASGTARLVPGGVALWIADGASRASLLCPAGHAELDLTELWGRVCPSVGAGDASNEAANDIGPLLTTCTALLLGRAGVAMLNASAIIDMTGGGWLIVGPREERSLLVRAFVRDGCDFVSDDQVLLRAARHQAGLLLIESWHRSAVEGDSSHAWVEPPSEKWKPVAQLRGLLLTRSAASRTPLAWRAVRRDMALASLLDACPHLDSDPAMGNPIRDLLASCSARPAIAAVLTRGLADSSDGVVRQLANAIDAIL